MLGSKFGADCSLLLSPVNTKVGCCPLVLLDSVLLEVELELELLLLGRSNIQGTATCLPPLSEDELLLPRLELEEPP